MNSPINKFQILMKYFIDNFSLELMTSQRAPRNWYEQKGEFYFERLIEFHSATEKIDRYSLYFRLFYPNSNEISEEEAMEHHWHSYMQDLYIVKERGVSLLQTLKKDLPKYQIGNPSVAMKLIEHLKKNLEKGLASANFYRANHTHQKTARHPELVKVKGLKIIRQYAQNSGLNLNQLNQIENKIAESTNKSKAEYIQMADQNKIAVQSFRNFFYPRFGHLFASLNGHDWSMFKIDER